MDQEKHINVRNDLGDDFKNKVKSWFQSRGILRRLELYLKNQMIVEFQRSCGRSLHSQNTTISPKIQAVKVLVADFLLQEDLLFSLSVYCTEVPFLLNLSRYDQYVSHLADVNKNSLDIQTASKPKFSKEELIDILEALNLNLNANESDVFYRVYKSEKTTSLLASLLGTTRQLIKKHRTIEYLLKKARKKEKLFQRLLKIEKGKVASMYAIVQKAYGIVEKHKSEMKELLRNNEMIQRTMSNEMKSSELMRKENELTKILELKERSLEKSYRNKLQEIEDREKMLEKRELELQSKYQILQQGHDELTVERERIERTQHEMQTAHVGETDKLREFEEKFHALQAEVQQLLETYNERRQQRTDSKNSSDQQTENEILNNMEEYVNLMEKENSLLKLSSNKQRNHITQLRKEVVFLKSRLDHLEKEMELRKHIEAEIRQKETVRALFLSNEHCHLQSERNRNFARESTLLYPTSRRKLFRENETTQSSEFSSSSTSKEANLTDEIVADAKNKVQDLENESEALNRNFKSLHNILTRNIALSESKSIGSLSVDGLSPRFSHLSRSYSDTDSPIVSGGVRKYALSSSWEDDTNQEHRTSSPKAVWTSSAVRRSNSFRELFMKRKKGKTRSEDADHLETDSELSSPGNKVDGDTEVQLRQTSDSLANKEATDVDHKSPIHVEGTE